MIKIEDYLSDSINEDDAKNLSFKFTGMKSRALQLQKDFRDEFKALNSNIKGTFDRNYVDADIGLTEFIQFCEKMIEVSRKTRFWK